MEGTVKALGLTTDWRELGGRLPIRRDGSQLLEICVADTHPQRAKAVAEEIARQLILQSPTVQNAQDVEQRRAFVRQLTTTQGNIQRAETSLAEKQTALGREGAPARPRPPGRDQGPGAEDRGLAEDLRRAAGLGRGGRARPPSPSSSRPSFPAPPGPNARANVLMAPPSAACWPSAPSC